MSTPKNATVPRAGSGPALPIDPSLQHLQAEMSRLDAILRRASRRAQVAGQDPSDDLRGLRISDAEAGALARRPFGAHWAQTATLDPAEEQVFVRDEAAAQKAAEQAVASARQSGAALRLVQLAQTFAFSRFDLDVFLLCIAPALDLRYERLYGYLQDDVTRRRPTVGLMLDLLCEPGAQRLQWLSRFADDAPLFKHGLIERAADTASAPLMAQALRPDDAVVAWLLGHYQPDTRLNARLTPPTASDADAILAGPVMEALAGLDPASANGMPPVLAFHGPDESSQEAAARWLAHGLDRPLLAAQLPAVEGAGANVAEAVMMTLRDARLTGAVVYLGNWDATLIDNGPSVAALNHVLGHPDVVIVSSRGVWQARGVERERQLVWLEFAVPDFSQRHALWQHFLAEAGLALADDIDLTTLAGQFQLTATRIRDTVTSTRDAALSGQKTDAPPTMTNAGLFAAARAFTTPRLSGMARKITPRYSWSDIVLPDDQRQMLQEIVDTVRVRPKVLQEWGVGEKLTASDGVTVLFAGPPGTGKTMAAEVIARELGLDLYKIELSNLVSKYIGETEKNLERIFSEAENGSAILFFDEADAIFGKRSEVKDAHDRYANIEVSYLLQRMESYDGVTILATNLRANLDEAFTRRLAFAVDFPFPDEQYRLRIWESLFPPGVPREEGLDLASLAKKHRLAGGAIRNIIVSASYLAASDGGKVGMRHLLHGARRELQKMGRLTQD
jgi:AAA+ superfamily predicted ATPase